MRTRMNGTVRSKQPSAPSFPLRPGALCRVVVALCVGFSIAACDRSPVESTVAADGAEAAFNGADEEHSHFRFGTLSWRPLGGGEVEFRLISAFRRGYSGTGADGRAVTGDIITETIGATRLFLGDGTQTPVLQFLVTAHSVSGDWVIGEALNPGTTDPGILHTYTDPGPFEAELNTCCRIFASFLANRGNGGYRLLTTVDPFDTNRSPVSTQAPIVVVDEAPDAQFVVPAGDPDGDLIIWRLSSDAEAGGGPSPPGLTIDANTGVATWDNVGLDQTRFWTVQVVIEDGTTQTPVDFLLRIQPEVPPVPTCTIDPSGPIDAAVGQQVTLTVTGGPEGLAIEVNSAGLPPGASMDPSLPHSGVGPVASTFTWTPANGQEGSHPVVFSVSDETGQQALCSTAINVAPSKEVVILVHGLYGSPEEAFGRLPEFLEDEFEVVSFDYSHLTLNLCRTNTPIAPDQQTFDGEQTLVDMFALWLNHSGFPEELRDRPIHIVAKSMGGLIVQAYMTGMAKPFLGSYEEGDFESVMTLGTPHYGADARAGVSLRQLMRRGGCSDPVQERQLLYGSDLVWQLHQAWESEQPIPPQRLLNVVGVVSSGVTLDWWDGIVDIWSAVRPESQLTYVPCRHVDISLLVRDAAAQCELSKVDDPSDLILGVITSWLRSGVEPQHRMEPPLNAERGLILLRIVDPVNGNPIGGLVDMDVELEDGNGQLWRCRSSNAIVRRIQPQVRRLPCDWNEHTGALTITHVPEDTYKVQLQGVRMRLQSGRQVIRFDNVTTAPTTAEVRSGRPVVVPIPVLETAR